VIAKYGAGFELRDFIPTWRNNQDCCKELQRSMADFFGVQHVVLFSSARGALECLFFAIGGRGLVAIPAYNCIAVPEAVIRAGWQPLLIDIAPGSVNMTRDTIERGIIAGTKAVILTHQFGIPSEIESIVDFCKELGLFVIEDAAASLGARYRGRLTGTFGNAAIVSFGLTKVAPSGRLGALLTDDKVIAEKVTEIKDERAGKYSSVMDWGFGLAWWLAMEPHIYSVLRRGNLLLVRDNLHEQIIPQSDQKKASIMSPSDFVAKMAQMQLTRLSKNVSNRQELAMIYNEELSGSKGIGLCFVPDSAEPAWMQFPIFVEDKEHCYRFLLQHGVDLSWTFRYSCGESFGVTNTPNADKAAEHVLGLPTYEGISFEMAHTICALLREVVRK